MKLDFDWCDDGLVHEYCIRCKVETLCHIDVDGRQLFKCASCGAVNGRAIVIDPGIKSWRATNGEYCHEASGVFVRNDEGRFLFFRRRKYPFVWTVPAGHVEADEQPLHAARRELWEETGISQADFVHIGSDDVEGDKCRRGADRHVWHAFLVALRGDVAVVIGPEGDDHTWLSLQEADEQSLTVSTAHAIRRYRSFMESA